LPERAVYWARQRTLLIADPHFGKAATFRASGIPVPAGTTLNAVARLESVVARTSARTIVFLGDFLHAREGRSASTLDELQRWRERCRKLELILVRGNHDRHAGDPPAEMSIKCVDPPFMMTPFALAHHPRRDSAEYLIAGHLHPAVRLSGNARQSLRLPCFLFGASGAILPAFGDFTGVCDIEPELGDKVFAVADDAVIPVAVQTL
jgi:uncharacterized protein